MFSDRSQREKKSKKKFSPSDPLQAYYYLISHDDPKKYRVIGRSSVQKITNDKAVVTNIAGDVRILKSEQDEDDDDDNEISEDEDNDDDSYIGQSSTSCLKRPSDGLSTRNRSALKRSYNKAKTTSQSNQRFNRDRSLQRNGRCQSKVTVSHDLPAKNNSNNNHPDKITGINEFFFDWFTSSSQDDHRHIDTNTESKFKQEMISGIRSLKKTVSKLTKTVEYLTIPSLPKNDQLSSYRDENDKENFQDEIHLLYLTEREFSDDDSKTSADEIAASQQLFDVLKSFKDSYFNELNVYETLDFDDEYDEIAEEEESTDEEDESIDDMDDFEENQQMHIYNQFTLEEMEDIIEWVDQHPNYKFTTIKHRFQKVKFPNYISRFREYIKENGTRLEKLDKIKQFMWDEFYIKRAIEKEAVHDTDLERFAI
ncbi:unnamed protein product [Rotaria socialis]|uniref:Uncharacterized protein n=1 Tax=Rotaria socialis TaxID=392032 RepID=A0A821MYD4_9BILA|nr:unnamed protein product [Rotaria socialis]